MNAIIGVHAVRHAVIQMEVIIVYVWMDMN